MRLELDLEGHRGAFAYRFRLHTEFDGLLGVIGPSGSGKTTLLRALCGLDPAATGTVVMDGRCLATGGRHAVPPESREIALVFQEAALFPDRDVRRNLEFAWRRRCSRQGPSFAELVEELGLQELLGRAPETLSGGERQRVAIARGLAYRPRLLLLDEPVSALDREARRRILELITSVPRRFGTPIVQVGHATSELLAHADRMAWIEAGAVRKCGSVEDLVSDPECARSVGEELSAVIPGQVRSHDEADALTEVATALGPIWIPRARTAVGECVRLRARARDLSLGIPGTPRGSILNAARVRVITVRETQPGERLLVLEGNGGIRLMALITRRSRRELEIEPGREIEARIKAVSLLA